MMLNPLKLQEMLGQAKQMQEQIQQKLAATVIEASSGGGAVTVKMNGKKEVLKVTIDPAATWRCWRTCWPPPSTKPAAAPTRS